MRHAYLIVANGNWKVVSTCLTLLDCIDNDIYLLIDKKVKADDSLVELLRKNVSKSRIEIYWKKLTVNWGYSQIEAVLFLMKQAYRKSADCAYYHFWQGSDLPIQPLSDIDAFFERNCGHEFINVDLGRTAMAENKCWYWHFFCHSRYFRTCKIIKAANFLPVYFQKALRIRKNTDIQVYQGSALFSITRDFAKYVLEHESEIFRRFRFSLAADECFMQTIVMNSEYKNAIVWDTDMKSSTNAMLIDRTRPDGKNSPHIWRNGEFSAMIESAAKNDYQYARKFVETVDMEIVHQIQKSLMKNR